MKTLAIALSVIAFALAFMPAPAHAESLEPTGTSGTCSWVLSEGTLYIYPTEGESGELGSDFGWQQYADQIANAMVLNGVSATNLSGMFYDCDALTWVDLSGLNTANVTDMSDMFNSCDVLRTVYVGGAWSVANVVNSAGMFTGCPIIAGGIGTIYDASHTDAAYAHVDAAGAPGYFVSAGATPVHEPGWALENGAYRYYELNGKMRTSTWLKLDGSWYYVGADGAAYADTWAKLGGVWYYFNSDRTMAANEWAKYGNAWYYLKSSGAMAASCWVKDEGAWYYLGSSGKLVTNNWVYYRGKYYYMGASGKMYATQQVKYKGKYYYFGASGYCTASSTHSFNTSLNSVLNACRWTASPGSGLCAAWVTNVFNNAGVGVFSGDADDMCNEWCYSTNKSALKPGMIIAVTSTSGNYASWRYGHVGIYVGNGTVVHNYAGRVGTMSLSAWLKRFGDYTTPRWGWLGGVVLN